MPLIDRGFSSFDIALSFAAFAIYITLMMLIAGHYWHCWYLLLLIISDIFISLLIIFIIYLEMIAITIDTLMLTLLRHWYYAINIDRLCCHIMPLCWYFYWLYWWLFSHDICQPCFFITLAYFMPYWRCWLWYWCHYFAIADAAAISLRCYAFASYIFRHWSAAYHFAIMLSLLSLLCRWWWPLRHCADTLWWPDDI